MFKVNTPISGLLLIDFISSALGKNDEVIASIAAEDFQRNILKRNRTMKGKFAINMRDLNSLVKGIFFYVLHECGRMKTCYNDGKTQMDQVRICWTHHMYYVQDARFVV